MKQYIAELVDETLFKSTLEENFGKKIRVIGLSFTGLLAVSGFFIFLQP